MKIKECTNMINNKNIDCLVSGADLCPGCEFEERIIIKNENDKEFMVCRGCMAETEFDKLCGRIF